MSDQVPEVPQQLYDELRVIAALEGMLRCERRGLCLLKEWMRRYGNPGNGCNCWWQFTESYVAQGRDLDI